jgi:hypothetical protein
MKISVRAIDAVSVDGRLSAIFRVAPKGVKKAAASRWREQSS